MAKSIYDYTNHMNILHLFMGNHQARFMIILIQIHIYVNKH